MTYQEALDFLYQHLPMYQRVGASALKKDLTNTRLLCEHLNNPQLRFPSVHIAGTNGKGSSAHMIAAILQKAGYKTGLYTSPHLKDFTERIRINGKLLPQKKVIKFVKYHQKYLMQLSPSFFEMTVALAFHYFAEEDVDVAVVEVGLGGRLDSTNILTPILSLITNIGLDHTDMLGDTLAEIAYEKAGIIKTNVPAIIGSYHPETLPVFRQVAEKKNTPLLLAYEEYEVFFKKFEKQCQYLSVYHHTKLRYSSLQLSLLGNYQRQNLPGVLTSVDQLIEQEFKISEQHIRQGLQSIQELTGLKGRWQIIGKNPMIVADTGHNQEAFSELIDQITHSHFQRLYMVLGFVQGKNLRSIVKMLPSTAKYYICQPNVPRAKPVDEVREVFGEYSLDCKVIPDVNEAVEMARQQACADDFVFVGGSTFVVAELESL